jgi:hypothetical protein
VIAPMATGVTKVLTKEDVVQIVREELASLKEE